MKKLFILLMPVFFSGQFATAQSALTFDASTPSYVEVGSAMNGVLEGTNTITAEAWCYLTDYSNYPTITGNYDAGLQFLLRMANGNAEFYVNDGDGYYSVLGSTTISLNTWTHIAAVWDGSELRVYVDGVLDGTTTGVIGAFQTCTDPLRIGANQLSEGWSGNLDAVGIWSTARTSTEINTTMASCLTGGEAGLLALYNFDEASGTTAGDMTGNGYNGTLINSPVWTSGYSSCGTLSVNFISISANRNSNGVLVNWRVGAEQDMVAYETERSEDGRNFSRAGTVTANGSSSYNWVDVSGLQQQTYYRVKSIDKRGIIKYSAIAKVSSASEPSTIRVWPNPVQGNEMNLQFKNQPAGRYGIRLLDAAGRVLFAAITEHRGGNSIETINLSSAISRGFYQLVVIAPDKTVHTQKLFISKAK
jgi:hypothetical protein